MESWKNPAILSLDHFFMNQLGHTHTLTCNTHTNFFKLDYLKIKIFSKSNSALVLKKANDNLGKIRFIRHFTKMGLIILI